MNLLNLMDQICREALGVDQQEYVDKLDILTLKSEWRAVTLVDALMSEDKTKHEQAKRIWALIK